MHRKWGKGPRGLHSGLRYNCFHSTLFAYAQTGPVTRRYIDLCRCYDYIPQLHPGSLFDPSQLSDIHRVHPTKVHGREGIFGRHPFYLALTQTYHRNSTRSSPAISPIGQHRTHLCVPARPRIAIIELFPASRACILEALACLSHQLNVYTRAALAYQAAT